MSWDVTMMFIHLAAFCCVLSLHRSAPCWLQKIAVGLLSVAMVFYTAMAVAVLVAPDDRHLYWVLKRIASAMEHIGVLIYVFRLAYKEHVECKVSTLRHSHPQSSR